MGDAEVPPPEKIAAPHPIPYAAWLWGDRGRNAEASDLLAPIYGWFTEGLGTLDLKDARILVDAPAP